MLTTAGSIAVLRYKGTEQAVAQFPEKEAVHAPGLAFWLPSLFHSVQLSAILQEDTVDLGKAKQSTWARLVSCCKLSRLHPKKKGSCRLRKKALSATRACVYKSF